MKKLLTILLVISIVCASLIVFVACNKGANSDNAKYRFVAPEGTPALAIAQLLVENTKIAEHEIDYSIVSPSTIASEMGKSEIVIMPVNAGAMKIKQGADYKLVSIAVDGSLFVVGNTASGGAITMNDLKGNKVACIGQTGVPGLVFRYILQKNGIQIVDENTTPTSEQISVKYVADGPAAMQVMKNGDVKYALVGEPAATQFKSKLSLNAEMNIQEEYVKCDKDNGDNFPQAGIFVKTALVNDKTFLNALYDLLDDNKDWIEENEDTIQEQLKNTGKYEGAVFPAAAISRCAVNDETIPYDKRDEIIAFLGNVMPKDSNSNPIDWESVELFV